MNEHRIESFAEFWSHYVGEHSKAGTRALHLVGTSVGLACAGYLVARQKWWLLPLAFVPGYAAAWAGHFFIEHNKPATFQYPLWSLIADYKMVGLMLAGKMKEEVKRAGAQRPHQE